MTIAMVAYQMSLADHTFHQIRKFGGFSADAEERRLGMVAGQHIKYCGCVGVGPIVKSQRYHLARRIGLAKSLHIDA